MSASAEVAVLSLLEREAELARVDRVFDRVGAGAGALVVVEGPAGIGKSELLMAVGRGAQARGFGVLAARCSEFEEEIAFGVARQLFEPMLRAASSGERRGLLAGVAQVGARALGAAAGEPPADRFAAIHGLYWLCANRAERDPLVVAVDDVQWVDDSSLAWLGYLARRVGDLALVLVLGLRSGDPGGERAELAQLVSDRDAERLALAPLSGGAVSAIVRAQLDEGAEESFCAAVSGLSGGNPLFVRELLAAAREQGLSACSENVEALRRIAPTAVATSVLGRLGRLGAESVALARAVAVLGDGVEVGLAARLAQLDPVVGELTADRLAAAHILASARPLEFFHPSIGAAVRDDIAPGARRIAHRRAADLIDGEEDGSLGRVAAHLLACGPAGDEWVVKRLRDAAIEALDRGAPEIAASYVRRALSEPPAASERAAVMLLLGTAEWRTGQVDAIAHLERALGAVGEDLGTLIGICTLLALAYNAADQVERAVAVLERGFAAFPETNAVAVMGDAGLVMIGLTNQRTAPAAARRAERLRGRLSELVDPPVHVLVALAWHAARVNRADEAQKLAERALACEPYPPPLELCGALLATLALVEGYEALERLCEDLLAAARRHGAMQEMAMILVHRAWALCDRGALADAEADARWVLDRAQAVRQIHATSELLRVLIERDELDAAEDALQQCDDPRRSGAGEVVRFLFARGRLRAAQGRRQEALEDFLDCGGRCERLRVSALSAGAWGTEAALVHAALGDVTEARRLAGMQLELARRCGRPRTLGIALRASGLVETGETRLEFLREGVTTLERSQSPIELARALSDYGAALRRAGRRVQARAELERALDLAHHCGARRIANQAREELIAAGAKPRRDAISGRDALTAAELRVARLAAEGLTNREIAQALFITTKTATGHLSRIYRKLEITRRGQLASVLAGPLDASHEQPGADATIP